MTWVSRPVAAAAALLVAAVAAAGCAPGRSDTPTSLPPITATPTPSASTSPTPTATSTGGLSDEAQIKAVYLDYSAHSLQAERLPAGERRAYLEQWLVPSLADQYVRGIAAQLKSGSRSRGHDRSHLMTVRLERGRGVVEDCLDESGVILVSASGKTLKRGKKNIWVHATYVRRTSGWRMATYTTPEKRCTAS